MKRVLVFPCGSEIGLEIYRSLKYNKDFSVVGASSIEDHGKYVYEEYYETLPLIDEVDFIDKLNLFIDENKIDIIYPAHDSVVLKLAQNREEIKAKVVVPDTYTCEICRSKKKTYQLFDKTINVPKMYDCKDIKENDFPLFLKPDVGQGSKGTQKIKNFKDLDFYYKSEKQLILEYLPYEEYTIDCFTDFQGNLVFCSGRIRSRISNGISVGAKRVKNKEFTEIAKKINDILKFNGAWFFQLKLDKNKQLSLLEIAPRIAGTMEFQRLFGVNLPLLNLYNILKIKVSIIENSYNGYLDRALSSSYKIDYDYDYIYIDFDDVLIQNDKVNYLVLAFLYKCLNNKKEIFLLTRHSRDCIQSLAKYRINKEIFTEIIHIKDGSLKSNYIKQPKSIFIDDSHRERLDVYEKCNIPVFDVNMIDILL